MILDSGLDAACTSNSSAASATFSTATYPFFSQFVTYAAFGTGSSEPDATDTSLDAQVGARTQARGGFNNTQSAGVDQDNLTIWTEQTFTRVFNITENVNAAEWGLAAGATGNLSARDLFRADPLDPNSTPIPLTLEEGDQLQLVITLRVQAVWDYEEKSFIITGTAGNDSNGTHTGNATVTNGNGNDIVASLECAWPGQVVTYLHVVMSDVSDREKNDNLSSASVSTPRVLAPYTPGDHYRDANYALSTSEAVGDIYALNIGPSHQTTGSIGTTNASSGYRFLLTNPPFLTKENTHRLTLTLRKSISRL